MAKEKPLFVALSESDKKKIEGIVGPKHVDCVEDAILAYDYRVPHFKNRPTIPQLNKTFGEVRKSILSLKNLLGNAVVCDYLFGIANEHFTDDDGKKTLFESSPFLIDKTRRFQLLEVLEELDKVLKASIDQQNPGPGKPKGQKDEAVHKLLDNLYQCCKSANDKPLTVKKGNKLERLVEVLNPPLCLGGNLPFLIRKVIERNSKK